VILCLGLLALVKSTKINSRLVKYKNVEVLGSGVLLLFKDIKIKEFRLKLLKYFILLLIFLCGQFQKMTVSPSTPPMELIT